MRPLILLLLIPLQAYAGPYWFRTMPPAEHVSIVYVDTVICGGESADLYGCYQQIGGYGLITIRKGLPEYVEKCTLAHEKHHAEGWRHPSEKMPFLDCGDGQWISATTLEGMK